MVTLQVLINGVPAPDAIPVPVTIVHGRAQPESQPDAADCTLEWLDPATIPRLGDTVVCRWVLDEPSAGPPIWDDPRFGWSDRAITWGGQFMTTFVRFTGRIVDMDVQEDLGQPVSARITAVSPMADLGRRHYKSSRPQETELQRVAAIAASAGVTIITQGNAGPPLGPTEVDADALTALHDICLSTGGVLWHDLEGNLWYGTGDHRSLAEPVGALPDTVIVDRIHWQTSTTDLLNRVLVSYAGSTTPSVLTDDESIARFGVWETSVNTALASQTGADQLGNLILARRAWPFARVSDVLLDSRDLTEPDLLMLAATLRVSDAVLLPIPPDPGPTGEFAEWVVEGWVENWTLPDTFQIQLAVTDRERFAQTTLRPWSVADDFTWGEELDRGRWLDTLILQPGEAAA